MFLARVIGRVVATQRVPGLLGEKFLIVQPLDEQRAAAGDTLVACDAAESGLQDIVHVCDGRESTLALHDAFVPVDATIVGHVEEFAHEGPGPRISAGDLDGSGAPAPPEPDAARDASRRRAGPGDRTRNGLVP